VRCVPGSRTPTTSDVDDWFGEDDWFAEESSERSATRPEPTWPEREPEHEPSPGTRVGEFTFTLRALLVAAGLFALVVVVVVLAVAGVFSSGKSHAPPSGPSRPVTTGSTTTHNTPTVPATKPPAAPTSTLKPGDTGTQVKLLQRALARLGYSPGKVDGDYGSSTQTAVKQLQQASKLAADGVLGPQTLRALKRALASG
jgi:hypothetical protein